MLWRTKPSTSVGSAFFRGKLGPRLSEIEPLLTAAGVRIVSQETDNADWRISVTHPTWGDATIMHVGSMPPLPKLMIDLDPYLDAEERELGYAAGAPLTVRLQGKKQDVLHDRKHLLRYLRLLLGDDGVIAVDHVSSRVWSISMLDDELMHDAPLDVDSLIAVHVISNPTGSGVDWLHTHGLGELGSTDFDILSPHEATLGVAGRDLLRALAFRLLDGTAKPGEAVNLVGGVPLMQLVPAKDFMKRAAADERARREDSSGEHSENRVVLCEPKKRGLASLFGSTPTPHRWLQSDIGENPGLIYFPDDATALMAERARATWQVGCRFFEELAEFECKPLVKIGYDTDGGSREHLWFEPHAWTPTTVEATLLSSPFDIASMNAGDRGTHPIEKLTDWMISGPTGTVNPRDFSPVRRARGQREQIFAFIAKAKADGSWAS